MNIAPVAYRYARSLMSLAQDKGQLELVHEDMLLVANTCRDNRELVLLMRSPVVKSDKKEKVLDRVFAGKIGQITSAFMGILARKGREALLPDVAAAFENIYKVEKGILTCNVTSATKLNARQREQVIKLANEKHPGKEIELIEQVDPAIIGGVVIRIGDEQYDGSVDRRLHDLRRRFSENPYIPEI